MLRSHNIAPTLQEEEDYDDFYNREKTQDNDKKEYDHEHF